MRSQSSTFTTASTAEFDDEGVRAAERLADKVRRRWRKGEAPDVVAVLNAHPELKTHKSVVLNLAYDEYLHHREHDQSLDADKFSRRFPTLQQSLYLLIEVNRLLGSHPDFQIAQEAVSWLEPGTSFLDFSLLSELGRGTFGRVFLASEPNLGNRQVALKIAPQGGQEAEVLGKLRHANIVPVHSVRDDDSTGLTAVCMPYLGRATLADLLDRAFEGASPPLHARVIIDTIRELSDDDASADATSFDRILRHGTYVEGIVHLAIQLADGLSYAHSRGVCHRDLKPSNVLLSQEGRPLLLDFNLSSDEQIGAGRLGGTLPYMAPEQLQTVILRKRGIGSLADPRTDLFSLGIILHQLLCGSLPFGDLPSDDSLEQAAQQLLRQQEAGPLSLREKNRRVEKSLARLIADCLAYDPEDRPESAGTLAAALRKQLSPMRRGRRWVRAHPRRAWLVSVLSFGGALALGGYLAFRDPYSMRQYKEGLELYERGLFDPAVACFNKALESDPDNPEILLARGCAHARCERYSEACLDLFDAEQLAPTAHGAACRAYCLSRKRMHDDALTWYRKALRRDPGSAEVLNNFGYSLMQLSRLDEARLALEQAVAADGNLAPAYGNLVGVYLNQAYGGRPVERLQLALARRAARVRPPSAELCRQAASLHVIAALEKDLDVKRKETLLDLAQDLLDQAVQHGLDPSPLKSDSDFEPLFDSEEFRKMLQRSPGSSPTDEIERLIRPF